MLFKKEEKKKRRKRLTSKMNKTRMKWRNWDEGIAKKRDRNRKAEEKDEGKKEDEVEKAHDS